VPKGADPVTDDAVEATVAVETVVAAALGNNGRAGGIDAPETGGCIPDGIPGIAGIMLQENKIHKEI